MNCGAHTIFLDVSGGGESSADCWQRVKKSIDKDLGAGGV
jgi:hypothetical protein